MFYICTLKNVHSMYVYINMIYDLIKYVYIQTYCNCNSYESNI